MLFDRVQQGEIVFVRRCARAESEDMRRLYTMLTEQVRGEINSSSLGILAHVTQNGRQLKCDAGIDGRLLGETIGGSEDANADQSHHRRDQVTILMQRGEVLIDLHAAHASLPVV